MDTLSTGQIIFVAGIAGTIFSAVATLVSIRVLHKQKKKLREEIWREYH